MTVAGNTSQEAERRRRFVEPAKETCLIFHDARTVLHWSSEDPAEAQGDEEPCLTVFRRVRSEIAERVRAFLVICEERPSKDRKRTSIWASA